MPPTPPFSLNNIMQGWSRLTARQPGLFPQSMTGPLPSAAMKGLLGAGAGLLAEPLIASTSPDWDRKRLRAALMLGGAGLGAATSIPDLATSKHWIGDPSPFSVPKQAADHKYGCVLHPIPDGELRDDILAYGQRIDSADLCTDEGDDGLDADPHVTVLYGLHDEVGSGEVREKVEGFGPVEYRLGRTSLFTENPDHDVLKISVTGRGLHDLNRRLAQLPHTNSYGTYKPHLTIAYLKKNDDNKRWSGDDRFDGELITCNSVRFSSADKEHTRLELQTESSGTRSKVAEETYSDPFGPTSNRWIHVGPAAETVLEDPYMAPVTRSVAMQILNDAAADKHHGWIQTGDLVDAAVGAGLGYMAGNLTGRILGAVLGLPPNLQRRASQAGALGGLLNAVGALG
jgi:2'-5' RNA ligase